MNKFSDIRGLKVTALIAVASLVLVSGCQQAAVNVPPRTEAAENVTTARPMFSDEKIRQDVLNVIRDTGSKAEIHVEVKEQIVALSGEVSNLAERVRIVEAAKSVPGVKAVVRYVDVKPSNRLNAAIEKDIRVALGNNPVTRSINPVISVNNGVVALAGTGSEWQVKYVARRITETVPGVRRVLNPMCLPFEMSADNEIKKTITRRLAVDQTTFDKVSVEVSDGRVVLKGSVNSLREKLRAVFESYIDGVRDVSCTGLVVNESAADSVKNQSGLNDLDIERTVATAIAHDPRVQSSGIKFGVNKGTVTLSGNTCDLYGRSIAGLLASQVPGVQAVKNNLEISTNKMRSDQELTAALRGAILSDPSVDLYQLTVSVDHGRALLQGDVHTSREKWWAERIANHMWGIVSVENRLNVTQKAEPAVITYTSFPSWEFQNLWWMIPMPEGKSDTGLNAAFQRRLYWSPFIGSGAVAAMTDGDVTTITGTVRNEEAKKFVEDQMYEAGAVAVENSLTVTDDNKHVRSET